MKELVGVIITRDSLTRFIVAIDNKETKITYTEIQRDHKDSVGFSGSQFKR